MLEFSEIDKIAIGVSSCLMGEMVRYDGAHQRNAYLCSELNRYFSYIPICPEMGIGLGRPRPTISLVGEAGKERALIRDGNETDLTQALEQFAESQQGKLKEVRGYVLKSKSPSCGMKAVKLHKSLNGMMLGKFGVGVYAKRLMELFPHLPIEEEGRLNDAVLRENFIERVFAYHEWLKIESCGWRAKHLIDFHSRFKYAMMSHDYRDYKVLGRLVAGVSDKSVVEVKAAYLPIFMMALKRHCTRQNHSNVLYHILGYLREHLNKSQKSDIVQIIENYRKGVLPLVVPLSFFRHLFNQYPNHYIFQQSYLRPYPDELKLRNAI